MTINFYYNFPGASKKMKQILQASTILGLMVLIVLHQVQTHIPPPPPVPALPSSLPPSLFQLFVVRTGQQSSQDTKMNLPTRPALATVPVVDQDEPVVFFWYPMHPQVPIDAYLKYKKL